MPSFIFGGNTGETPESLRRKRELAEALLARSQGYVASNVGQGIAQLGMALAGRMKMGAADKALAAGRESGANAFSGLFKPTSNSSATAKALAGVPTSHSKTAKAVSGDFNRVDIARGTYEAAKALGIDPVDLATAMSYETAGTLNPVKAGPTTKWGQHKGLIQWGEPQAKQYGVDWSNPVASQLGANGAVVRYLKDRGVKPGMGMLDIYSAINAGTVGRPNASDAHAGGAPGTVADKVRNQMAGHREKAQMLLNLYNPGPTTAQKMSAPSLADAGRMELDITPSEMAGVQSPIAPGAGVQPTISPGAPAPIPGAPVQPVPQQAGQGMYTNIVANMLNEGVERGANELAARVPANFSQGSIMPGRHPDPAGTPAMTAQAANPIVTPTAGPAPVPQPQAMPAGPMGNLRAFTEQYSGPGSVPQSMRNVVQPMAQPAPMAQPKQTMQPAVQNMGGPVEAVQNVQSVQDAQPQYSGPFAGASNHDLASFLNHPYASPEHKQLVMQELERRMTPPDPMKELELEKLRRELDKKTPPKLVELYDQETGRPYKAEYDESTGEFKRVGGIKAPSGTSLSVNDGVVTFQQGEGLGNAVQTKGRTEVDKKYAQDYVEWTTGGAADAAKQLQQLKTVLETLKSGVDYISGPRIGNIPDGVKAFFEKGRESISARENVEEVVQRNLRTVLGAQFTEKEGERLIKRAFNPILEEADNAKRVEALVAAVEGGLEARNSAAEYYQKNGTLTGWKGKLPTVADIERAISSASEFRPPSQTDVKPQEPEGYSTEDIEAEMRRRGLMP